MVVVEVAVVVTVHGEKSGSRIRGGGLVQSRQR